MGNATLTRFFRLHFLIPFVVSALTVIHLFFLHTSGSSNPLGLNRNFDKIRFHPYFSIKDILGYVLVFAFFVFLVFQVPWDLGDPENFIPANPLVTPLHIQPEWYFLFAYAILRSIPNKVGGVLALLASVLVFYTLPFIRNSKFKGVIFSPIKKGSF